MADTRAVPSPEDHGILLTQADLESWSGRQLTVAEMTKIASAIPHSSIPAAISVIAEEVTDG